MTFNWIDIVIGIFVGWTTLHGWRRGLIRSVFDILALIVAIFLGAYWYRPLSNFVNPYLHLPEALSYVLCFALIWFIGYLIVGSIGTLLHKAVGISFFGPLNFLGGGLLGLAKGAVVVGIILQLIFSFPLPRGTVNQFKTSTIVEWMLPVLGEAYKNIFRLMPKEVPNISEFFKEGKRLPAGKTPFKI